jgi:hypothetical protein
MTFIPLMLKMLFGVQPAYAIVILPALILIPIAKMVAVVVATFALPAASVGVYLSKVTKNHKLGIILPVVIILVIALISLLGFMYFHPNNPIF